MKKKKSKVDKLKSAYRRVWNIKPTTKVKDSGKRYNRAKNKKIDKGV